MNKAAKIYGIMFLLIIVMIGIFQVNKKPVTNWQKSFDPEEKMPFGLYVFDQEVDTLFKGKLNKVNQAPYNFYEFNSNLAAHNILLIEKEIDPSSWKKILTQVERGSDAFIMTENLQSFISDTINSQFHKIHYAEQTMVFSTDHHQKKDTIRMDKFPGGNGFSRIDPKTTQILWFSKDQSLEDERSAAVFIKVQFGKGHLYLHSEPLLLSNYYLLKPNGERYVESIFSYLPNRKTIWFKELESTESSSPLRFILRNPPLRYAWYLFILGLCLFVLFNAKRKQRIVPIIEPLKNSSVEFVKSIGNLYLQEGDVEDMVNKKIQYFLHKVRMDFLIDTRKLDETFVERLHLKTGKDIELINQAVALIKKSETRIHKTTKEDLILINKLLSSIIER